MLSTSVKNKVQLRYKIVPPTVEPKHQPNFEAYNYYLAGRRLIEQRVLESYEKAIILLDQAIASDPLFAAAYASKAEAIHLFAGFHDQPLGEKRTEIESLINTALNLDPDLPEAYAVLGGLYNYSGDYENGVANLKRAISLNPNLAEAHLWLSNSYYSLGAFREFLHEIELASWRRDYYVVSLRKADNKILKHVLYTKDIESAKRFVDAMETVVSSYNLDSEVGLRNAETHSNETNGSDSGSDLYAKLLELDDLRQRGILNDAEFDAEKKTLLDGDQ